MNLNILVFRQFANCKIKFLANFSGYTVSSTRDRCLWKIMEGRWIRALGSLFPLVVNLRVDRPWNLTFPLLSVYFWVFFPLSVSSPSIHDIVIPRQSIKFLKLYLTTDFIKAWSYNDIEQLMKSYERSKRRNLIVVLRCMYYYNQLIKYSTSGP